MHSKLDEIDIEEMLNAGEEIVVKQVFGPTATTSSETLTMSAPHAVIEAAESEVQPAQPPHHNVGAAPPALPHWMNAIQTETRVNNAITGNIHSRENRAKAELKVMDAAQRNIFRQELARRAVVPLPKQLEVEAEFPASALPGDMARLIREVTDYLQVPIEAVGAALLAALFIAARGNYRIKVKADYTEALTEYLIVSMPSGSRKSAIVEFFRRVFADVEKERQIEFDQGAIDTGLTKEILREIKAREKATLLNELLGNDALKHSEIAAIIADQLKPIEDELLKADSRPRLLTDSPTPKKLAMIMGRQGEAIGFFEAEGGFLKQRIRPDADDILLKGYTMEPFSNETSTADSIIMRAPCLAFCSFVQLDVVEKLYSKEELKDHGVLPRILPTFASWRGEAKAVNTIPVSEDMVRLYESKIRKLLALSRPQGAEGERTWHELDLSPEARATLQDFQHQVNWQVHEEHFNNFEAFGDKLAGHAVRLAGAIHLWNHEVPHAHPISHRAMAAGIALARFYAQHAMAAFDMEHLQAIEFAQKILKWHRRERKPEFPKREAQRRVGRCSADQIQAGINLLERHGFLGQYLKPEGGVMCIMNPHYDPSHFTF